jgi:hypothetical protein
MWQTIIHIMVVELCFQFFIVKRKDLAKILTNSCTEPEQIYRMKMLQLINKKFKIYVVLSIIYGLIFINYIDIAYSGDGYHLWLIAMYFFPFFAFSIFHFRRNFRLTLSLGLIASLMNDLFFGPIKYLLGLRSDLLSYFTLWLIPSNHVLFNLNLGFATVQIYSWMMAFSIYGRIALVCIMLRVWKIQADARCIDGQEVRKKTRLKFWDKIIERL